MATIKDIANRLGVSVSTVSKGLNGASDISDELRQMVLDTAVVPVEDIEVYDIEASFTVNLSPSGDGKDHVAVFSIGLSLNTKSDGYKSIGTEGLKAKETLIKNDINTIVSGYTMEQFREDEQSVKDAILEDLQEMFGSDFIVGVSFSSVNTQ